MMRLSRSRARIGAGIAHFVVLVACHEITDPIEAAGLLSLDAPSTAAADGATPVTVTVKVDTLLEGDARKVTLTTTAGTFDDDGEIVLTPDATGTVVALLTPPGEARTALITAVASGDVLRRQIEFMLAPAEQLILNPSSFVIEAKPGADIEVEAKLRRTNGAPSPGVSVAFSATDTTGTSIGFFSNPLPSDAQGSVKARYTVGATPYRGRVVIRATAAGATAPLSGQATVQVVAPE